MAGFGDVPVDGQPENVKACVTVPSFGNALWDWLRERARKSAENSALIHAVLVNQSVAHAELIATFTRAQAEAAHKLSLIKAVENKGPKAIEAAIATAAKAAKRRDSYAKKLSALGVRLKD